jgi:hypothetical protein
MEKKKQVHPIAKESETPENPEASEVPKTPKVQTQKIRVLAAVPACHIDHVQYREQVVNAVKAAIRACPEAEVTLNVCEEADNSVAETNGWNSVVAAFQKLSDRIVAEGYDYLWLIEADVVIPPNALSHLLSDEADLAAAVVPYHFQNYLLGVAGGEIYRNLACTGYFLPDKQGNPTFDIHNLYLKEIQDKLLVGSPEHMIFNGTGCILIKRAVFEKIWWRWDNKVCGFDVYFWQDAQRRGFKCVTDGFVVCQHLGK